MSSVLDAPFVVEVKGVNKRFVMYERREDYLKQAFIPAAARLLGPFGGRWKNRSFGRDFWALRDISFSVGKGEAFGIVGQNGAGKSTLLQIIAGTLTPSSGSVSVRGRVAALLELGSGFNPEFTGLENIFLNGAIYGLSRAEVEVRLDEIVQFADIGEFVSQPVKTYSSGMTMRLAFSVQLALHPDVLIVDEALSVGDVFFQAKCMARLRKLIDQGVTVLFVTHDMSTVSQFCTRALLLKDGRLIQMGSPKSVIDEYARLDFERRNARENENDASETPTTVKASGAPVSKTLHSNSLVALRPSKEFEARASFSRAGNSYARYENIEILGSNGPTRLFEFGEQITLSQLVRIHKPLTRLIASWRIKTPKGIDVIYNDLRLRGPQGWDQTLYSPGELVVFEWTFKLDLLHGQYVLGCGLGQAPLRPGDDWTFIDMVPFCLEFAIAPRRAGMIDGLVTIDADCNIHRSINVHAEEGLD